MTPQNPEEVARQAELIYRQRLRPQLEQTNLDDFVAIEPVSGEFFLAPSLSEAIGAARKAHPKRLAYAIRVGHKTAVHIGSSLW